MARTFRGSFLAQYRYPSRASLRPSSSLRAQKTSLRGPERLCPVGDIRSGIGNHGVENPPLALLEGQERHFGAHPRGGAPSGSTGEQRRHPHPVPSEGSPGGTPVPREGIVGKSQTQEARPGRGMRNFMRRGSRAMTEGIFRPAAFRWHTTEAEENKPQG